MVVTLILSFAFLLPDGLTRFPPLFPDFYDLTSFLFQQLSFFNFF